MLGKIKVIKSTGYGFIETADEIDYFFHYKTFDGNWKQLTSQYIEAKERDQKLNVEFEPDKTATNGPAAKFVKLLIEPRTAKGSLD